MIKRLSLAALALFLAPINSSSEMERNPAAKWASHGIEHAIIDDLVQSKKALAELFALNGIESDTLELLGEDEIISLQFAFMNGDIDTISYHLGRIEPINCESTFSMRNKAINVDLGNLEAAN